MPTLDQGLAMQRSKVLLLGDSGTGKTGALSSLVNAGYSLLILDFDNGVPILANYVKPEFRSAVHYATLTDKMGSVDGKPVVMGTPKAFSTAMQILTNGKMPDGEDLGDPARLGEKWVVVIDSLTRMSRAAYNWHQHLAAGGRFDPRNIYFEAQKRVIDCLALLNSEAFDTHVVVIAHIDYVDDVETTTVDDDGKVHMQQKGMPKSIGKAIATEIPAYFNTVVRAKVVGSGGAAKRVIRTTSEGIVALKNAKPSSLPAELPLQGGLADIFKKLQET